MRARVAGPDCRRSPLSATLLSRVNIAVVLNACGTQTPQAATVDGSLPACKLFDAQSVSRTCLVYREQAARNCGDHLSLPAGNPARCVRRWKGLQAQWLSKWPNHLGRPCRLNLERNATPPTERATAHFERTC